MKASSAATARGRCLIQDGQKWGQELMLNGELVLKHFVLIWRLKFPPALSNEGWKE